MKIIYITLISVFIFASLSRLFSEKYKSLAKFYYILALVMLVAVAGLRTNIGDTGMYAHFYYLADSTAVFDGGYESGFVIFILILKSISMNPQFMIFMTSFITHFLNMLTMKAYSTCVELATYLYIASGYYIAAMNGIRQSLVAAVLFASTKLIIDGKFKIYLLVVVLMSTFHCSALIMIPIYFIVRLEAWSPKIYKIIFIFAIGMIFFQPLMDRIFGLLQNTKYGQYSDFNEGGANVLRVLVSAVPVILAYMRKNELKEKLPESNVLVNMTLVNFIIMSFSLYNWIFARFIYYTQLYTFVILAIIIKNCSVNKEKNFLYYLCVIFYFVFFYYDHVITLGIQYRSNYLNF
ncbi:EpsG family protein [Clostridium grantii]|uniref:EpsG family protein n=1 Tax=Clostridium grantii DSM 8605 TaxID=1121316 RepID=A0A1M5UZ95_9CLOT|nr:EpsG family protein [Clostridium grantii]SHH68246.1 EpsG family protein [Clostridium grantii DSM 8605]